MKEEILKKIYRRHEGEPGFIMEWEEWSYFVRQAYPILVDVAKKKRLITHGDFAREGFVTYGSVGGEIALFSPEWFDVKIGIIVGGCSEYEYEEGRPLLSSIVVNKSTRYPGPGYWGLPGIPRELRKKIRYWEIGLEDYMDEARLMFWGSQVEEVYEYWQAHDC